MPRPIITRTAIDDLLAAGASELVLEPGSIVTALAREYAQDRGVRLVEAGRSATVPAAAPAIPAPATREQVRQAVLAQLGQEPANLTQLIDRVLKS